MTTRLRLTAASTLASAMLLMGCQTLQSNSASDSPAPAPAPAAAAPAPAPAPSRKEAAAAKKEEAKETKKSADGDITGTPAPGTRFNKVQLGMGMKQVTDLIGQPTDQGAYVTGKAWVPFYFGSDRYRHELLYKGQGRLVFAGGGMNNLGSGRLIRIIHNASESGYR